MADRNPLTLMKLFFLLNQFIPSPCMSITPQDDDGTNLPATLDFINITDMDVLTALSNLDPSKARGI